MKLTRVAVLVRVNAGIYTLELQPSFLKNASLASPSYTVLAAGWMVIYWTAMTQLMKKMEWEQGLTIDRHYYACMEKSPRSRSIAPQQRHK